MPQACSICNHSDRLQIEASLVAGMSLRDIAGQFSVSRNAVHRHKQNCIKVAIETIQSERKEHFVWNALEEMQWLHTEARAIYTVAKGAGDYGASIKALGEVRQQTKLFSELLAGQEPGQAEKLEAEWIAVREAIFSALEPFPDARLAVAEALFRLSKSYDHDASRQLLEAPTSDNSS